MSQNLLMRENLETLLKCWSPSSETHTHASASGDSWIPRGVFHAPSKLTDQVHDPDAKCILDSPLSSPSLPKLPLPRHPCFSDSIQAGLLPQPRKLASIARSPVVPLLPPLPGASFTHFLGFISTSPSSLFIIS